MIEELASDFKNIDLVHKLFDTVRKEKFPIVAVATKDIGAMVVGVKLEYDLTVEEALIIVQATLLGLEDILPALDKLQMSEDE